MSDDDRRLIAECLGGQRDAFGTLVSRYQTRLYNSALRLVNSPEDAADVVQDAFLSAYQALSSFKGDAEFFTWLYRIAFNIAVSLKRKRRPSVSLENYSQQTGLDPDDPSEYVKPSAALERTEDERQLHGAIARLSSEHREVLLLKDIDGLKYEDIAEALGVPIGTIRSRLHRARLELRDLLAAPDERELWGGAGPGAQEEVGSDRKQDTSEDVAPLRASGAAGKPETPRAKDVQAQPRLNGGRRD
ncbi:ECF RNA polymerase sigma-E factor [Gemmata obscuriglobus]|uniref:RNA polymerase sigma factor n=1 Tax=Gemmata obscuriglobus TaxID=114 RepID=UPI00016C377D|nr:sigma-70 family RNA polymerase sigma factor [Gemmata obscuriglobus]QEG29038.1 ECF RNA polymerase sigma-E factor [Gemmata obscuriglobus]VTS07651.1 rna sigma-24 ecf subfamily : RNA polymerase sigma factor OS=Blastopirellula marina DSM 3645 GN=DSM3645_09692 PE=3 SV=1: Sigma70_r2: Sigma70_r4_2 [Gemmata obscuriglobus UQM 2246]